MVPLIYHRNYFLSHEKIFLFIFLVYVGFQCIAGDQILKEMSVNDKVLIGRIPRQRIIKMRSVLSHYASRVLRLFKVTNED